jgi:hypothetical protein
MCRKDCLTNALYRVERGESQEASARQASDCRQPEPNDLGEERAMTPGWFFEDELSRLRWEWVGAMRQYAQQRSEASLRRARITRDAYTKRAADLHRAEQSTIDARPGPMRETMN